MNLEDAKAELVDLIVDACKAHFEAMANDFTPDTVFAYTLYCSSGCTNMGVGSCSRQDIPIVDWEGEDLPSWFGELVAGEWNYLNRHYENFQSVNNLIQDLYDEFYDGEIDGVNLDSMDADELSRFIYSFFGDVVMKAISVLKEDAFFKHQIFEKDVLLGIQFANPETREANVMEAVSREVNSEAWHNKMMFRCRRIRENANAV